MADSDTGPEPADTDARFEKIEAEQERQGSILDEIRAALKGGHDTPAAAPAGADEPAPADMAEQMRQAVRDVNAEQQQADHDRQHAADHDRMRRPEPETTPREAMARGKARLQRAMFGGDR